MLNRPLLGTTNRPAPPQRSSSGGPQYLQQHQASHHPNLPSRLSSVCSASRPSSFVHLTGDVVGAKSGEGWKRSMMQAGMGGSEDVIDLSDDADEGRPRKKARVESPGAMPDSPGQNGEDEVQEEDTAHRIVPGQPLALPPRPTASRSVPGASKQRVNDPARESDGLVPPPMATRLPPPKLVADFNPWTGDHPEDILSEQVIKAGYYDKPPGPSQNESNSARHSIWPNLSQKNNIGLQTLSHLFTQVLEKRQNLGRCTAPSSFKPPPRVTVTDTKREAWLKDLANTSIPLRRQSRTIPHGIRGKLLMDQCLAKSIPLQRAVWLAKCVGANELRAFRRKGVSGVAAAQGEAKWVRDWTAQVEQFLESFISACGQDDWRRKIDYAIKLVSAFYTEGLVDRDEYLSWIVGSFASASMESLPLWTIIVQIYWRDLVRCGRLGRRLARGILEHVHVLTEEKHQVFEPLKQRLGKLIVVLAVTERGCLVVPDAWQKYKDLLTADSLSSKDQAFEPALANVVERNERLAGPLKRTVENTRSPLPELYAKLDSADVTTAWDELSAQCVKIMPEARDLVPALLNWASTLYRRGHARVHLAARIITSIYQAGHDTDGTILAYIQNTDAALSAETENLWAVIVQLIQNQCFGTGRYLQWLIASGAVSSAGKTSPATGLLSALPAEKLPQHMQNLRMTLLRRLWQNESEDSNIEALKSGILARLDNSCMDFQDDQGMLKALSGSSKLAISCWIKSTAHTQAKAPGMSLSAFCVLRDVLEQMNDLVALSDVVESTLSTDTATLLASTADTVNMHALDFAIIGSLPTLVDRLTERHRTLRSQVPLDRVFLVALADLTKRFPDRAATTALLDDDLVLYEQQHSAAICSPASDSLIGMQAGNLDNDEEVDAVFASGNSMDEQTMQRVFFRVMQYAGKIETSATAHHSQVGRWLGQLRDVDAPGLEKLARQYVSAVLQKSQRELGGAQGIIALVCVRCLGLDVVVTPLGQAVSPDVAATLLRLLASPVAGAGLSTIENYSFRLQQTRFCADHPDQVAALLGKASEDSGFLVEDNWILDLALRTVVAYPERTRKGFTGSQPSHYVQQASGRLCKALLRQGRPTLSSEANLDPGHVITSADALNAPFCVGWLRMYLDNLRADADGSEAAIKEALMRAVAGQSQVWPLLLSAARPQMLKSIHEWARRQLLGDMSDSEDTTRLCEVLDVTYSAVQHEDDTAVITLLVERLRALETRLNDPTTASPNNEPAARSLPTLLHLCTLHAQNPSPSDSATQSRAQLLATLCVLLQHPLLQQQLRTLEHLHDVAAIFADALQPPILTTLTRTLNPLTPLLLSVLSPAPVATTKLALASRIAPPTASPAQPTAQTAQQRALASRQTSLPQVASRVPGQTQAQTGSAARANQGRAGAGAVEWKYTAFGVRAWEVMADPTPVMGENDCSLGVGLFGGRKV